MSIYPRLFLFLILILVRFNGLAYAADFQAKVIHITDGDTITVLNEAKEEIKIRLNGIDCPENAQSFGNRAKEFTKELVTGKMVTIKYFDRDRYGRTIGDVQLEDGRNLNQELVKAGFAWWYYRYSNDRELGLLELDAKLAHVGLWKDKNPVAPWVYRKIKDLLR
jgi:endonuclease YncB( thermonuclease family)